MKSISSSVTACAFVLVVGLWQGCSLDVPYENRYADPNAVTDAQSGRELLATAYAQLPLPLFENSVLSDDFRPSYKLRSNPSLQKFSAFNAEELENLANDLWARYYQVVAVSNAVEERADSLPQNAALRGLSIEAQRLKAYAYFQLLRTFAPTPEEAPDSAGIIFKDRLQMAALPRLTVRESVDSLRRMLEHTTSLSQFVAPQHEASSPVAFNNSAISAADVPADDQVEWFSATAAAYLRAELELYAGNYSAAETWAKAVLQKKGEASTLSKQVYHQLWQGNTCAERIFAPYINRYFYTDVVFDRQTGDVFTVNPAVVARYAATDVRKAVTCFDKSLPDSPLKSMKNCLGKYNAANWVRGGGTSLNASAGFRAAFSGNVETHFVNVYRTSGIYFILAEALAQQGKNAEAITVVNAYLSARGATLLSESLEGDALLRRILDEKQQEFVGEGERFFDLKRHRRRLLRNWTDGQTGKNGVKADDYRWNLPIPKGEYLYNERATQNNGWTRLKLGE